jgi:nitrate reductase beta subunit
MRVCLVDLEEQALAAAAATLPGSGHATFAVDVSDRSAVEALAVEIPNEHGPVSLLMNNAGVSGGGDALSNPDGWTRVIGVNFFGVLLYDADKIEAAASVADERDLYPSQLGLFLNPHDPEIIAEARRQGIPDSWLESAKRSPVYKMAMEWKVAFPLHPEYRTLPMVWYIPPLSPIQAAAESGQLGKNGILPDTKSLRIPVQYLANLLTAGDQVPVLKALDRMLAMRAYMRGKSVEGVENLEALKQVGLDKHMVEDMYHIMAIANYEDRFVIPSSHKEMAEDSFNEKGSCGFSFGNGCSDGVTDHSLFGKKKQGSAIFMQMPKSRKKKEVLDV